MRFEGDTIAAISTPIGQGGIGIVRISGPKSIDIVHRIFLPAKAGVSKALSRSLLLGHIIDPTDRGIVDEVLLTVMRSPNSYTKEDVAEINCHGGMVSVRKVLEIVISHGARLAEPGEFTKRAFLNGRISLPEAEAVIDLISSMTDESRRIAIEQLRGGLAEKLSEIRESLIETCALAEAYIDFPEDEIEPGTITQMTEKLTGIMTQIAKLSKTFQEARFFREGLSVAIVGRPNVGKSSLLNALLMKDRAIVNEVPGTTRDLIEDYLNITGLPVRIIDTAGLRHSDEAVEREGIRRSLDAMQTADFVIAVFDGSEKLKKEDIDLIEKTRGKNALAVINKSDLPAAIESEKISESGIKCLGISAFNGHGLDELKTAVFDANLKNWKEEREGLVVTNLRHKIALDRAYAALSNAADTFGSRQPLEIFSIEMRDALDSIGEITGAVTSDDILNRIFNNFCIGK